MKTLLLLLILLLPSCNLTVDPDSTRNWSFSGEAAKAIVVYATK
jgi:hypothetical protein